MEMTCKTWHNSQLTIGIDKQEALCECILEDGRIFSGRVGRVGQAHNWHIEQLAKYAALRAGMEAYVITQDEFCVLLHKYLFFDGIDPLTPEGHVEPVSPFQQRINKVAY